MKKILPGLIMLLVAQTVFAQKHLTPQQLDAAIASKAAIFALKVDREIVEVNEQINVKLQILVYDHDPAKSGPYDVSFDTDYDYDAANPSTEPYKITNWRILEHGSGNLIDHNDFAVFTAPANVPASRCATIVVDMQPNKPGLPKIELQQVIYIDDNPLVFYFDAPLAGISHEKYMFTSAGSMDQLAGMSLPPGASAAQMEKMAQLQKQLADVRGQANAAVAAKGYNADALMSNGKAIYNAEGDITVIQIMGDAKVSKGNQAAGTKNIMINLSFPGKGAGQKRIKSHKAIVAHIMFPRQQTSFGCENDPVNNPQEKEIHCSGGIINITSYTATEVKGTIHAQLQGFNCNGILDGKFTVKVANR